MDEAALVNDFDLSPEGRRSNGGPGRDGGRAVRFKGQRGPSSSTGREHLLKIVPRGELLGLVEARKAILLGGGEETSPEDMGRGSGIGMSVPTESLDWNQPVEDDGDDEEDPRLNGKPEPQWAIDRKKLLVRTEYELKRELGRSKLQRRDKTVKDWRSVNEKRAHESPTGDGKAMTVVGLYQPYGLPHFLNNKQRKETFSAYKKNPANTIFAVNAAKHPVPLGPESIPEPNAIGKVQSSNIII